MFARLVQPSRSFVRFRPSPVALLLLLFLANCGFMLLHVLFSAQVSIFANWRFGIGNDRGFAANFLYLQEVAVVLIATVLFLHHRREFVIGVLAAMFLYVFLDDAFLLHERVGLWLGEALQFPAFGSMRPQDLGEIITFGAFGLIFAGLLGFASLRGSADERRTAQVLLGLLALLGFCGVGFDALHMLLDQPGLAMPLALLEDGGEMMVISGFLCYSYRLLLLAQEGHTARP